MEVILRSTWQNSFKRIQLMTSQMITCTIFAPADCTISSLSQSGMFRKSMVFVHMSSVGPAAMKSAFMPSV